MVLEFNQSKITEGLVNDATLVAKLLNSVSMIIRV